MGNFCFDVTLGYRLSEKSRRWRQRATTTCDVSGCMFMTLRVRVGRCPRIRRAGQRRRGTRFTGTAPAEAARVLAGRFGVSVRQARRYVDDAGTGGSRSLTGQWLSP